MHTGDTLVVRSKWGGTGSGAILALQRYLMRYLMKASFPMREISTVMTLLHARYELEDLIRMENFQR
jgi:hypothetical protein